jgi:UDP-glucose 4-epimerase
MSAQILVTGGAGFIGSHLVDALVAAGEEVAVLDDFSTGEAANLEDAGVKGRLRLVQGSILDERVVGEAIEGCDRVFHLAVQCVRRSLGNPRESHDVNATGTLNVLEGARRAGVRRFIYCSSSEVYGNASSGLLNEEMTSCAPTTVYGGAKLAGEAYTEAYFHTYRMPTVVVRPFNAYGPRAHTRGDLAEVIPRFVIRALNGHAPVIFGDGSNGRDFTYVSDVARGLALRCDWGPQYIADAWINEVKWLGCTISPSYVGEPECNGVAERFMRTLKEQCIYLHQFASLEEARRLIGEFIARYNAEWLIERLGHRTPAQARAEALGQGA